MCSDDFLFRSILASKQRFDCRLNPDFTKNCPVHAFYTDVIVLLTRKVLLFQNGIKS